MADMCRAGLMHRAICAQVHARGWRPRGSGLPALEQVAPLQGVTGRWSWPGLFLFGVLGLSGVQLG